jgi:hypothetical protein
MVGAVEISGTNQPGNGRGVLRIKTGNQTGTAPICINLTETSLYSGFGRNLLNAAIFFIH